MHQLHLVLKRALMVSTIAVAVPVAVACGIDEDQGNGPANQPADNGTATSIREVTPAVSPTAVGPALTPTPVDQITNQICDRRSDEVADPPLKDSFFDGKVILELKAPSTVCHGESPISLDVIMTNEGQDPFTFDYSGNLLDFEILDDEGVVVWRHLYAYPEPLLTETLAPGESMAIGESKFASQGQWDLHDCDGVRVEPGKYQVRGIVDIVGRRMETSFKTVVVEGTSQIGAPTPAPGIDNATQTPPTMPPDGDVVSRLEERMADFPEDHSHPRFLEYSKHVPEWGGYYVEDGTVHIYLTEAGDQEEAKAFFAEEFSNIVTSRTIMHDGEVIEEHGLLGRPISADEIVVVEGQFTMLQLLEWHWLTAFKPGFLSGDFGVTQVNLSESKNRLTVGVKTQESEDGVVSKLEGLGIPAEAVRIVVDRPQVCHDPAK